MKDCLFATIFGLQCRIFLVSFCLIFLSSCAVKPLSPQVMNDGLEVSSPEAQGINVFLLKSAANEIYEPRDNHIAPTVQKNRKYVGITSILISRNNKLIFERYFNGGGIEKLVSARSFSKSVLSALIGAAIDKGYIEGVDESLYNYSDYKDIKNWDVNKANIKLKHLLTMTAGWDCGSMKDYEAHCGSQMDNYEDPYKWVLDLPMRAQPGELFNYNDAVHRFLGAIISISTKKYSQEFYEEAIMQPLQMRNNILLSTGTTSREMLKLGLLYLNKGRWKERQVLSEKWVEESTKVYVKLGNNKGLKGYGFLWWINEFEFNGRKYAGFYASGNGGQYVFVIPDLNIVAVFTGTNFDSLYYSSQAFEIMKKFVLPSVKID